MVSHFKEVSAQSNFISTEATEDNHIGGFCGVPVIKSKRLAEFNSNQALFDALTQDVIQDYDPAYMSQIELTYSEHDTMSRCVAEALVKLERSDRILEVQKDRDVLAAHTADNRGNLELTSGWGIKIKIDLRGF